MAPACRVRHGPVESSGRAVGRSLAARAISPTCEVSHGPGFAGCAMALLS